jgi:cytochrome P450
MSLRLGSRLTIVVSSPQAAELFLKTHDSVFASRPKVQSAEIFFYGVKGMALTPYGAYWRSVRKFCTLQLLNPAKIDELAGMRRGELDLLVESLKKAALARQAVDVSEKIITLVEDVVYKMLFGNIKTGNFDIKGCIVEYMHLAGAFNLSDYIPFLRPFDLQGLTKRMKATARTIDEILEVIVDEHEQKAKTGVQKHEMDFIDVMLSQKNKSTDKHDESSYIIDRTNIKAVVLDMIAGTLDTSYTAIEWILSELIRNPRVTKKLQEELKTFIGDREKVEEPDLHKFKYLDMVVKETLRLHPVAPLLVPHESLNDIVIEGFHIPKESRIFINTWAIGRDPKIWSENAEDFYPERFMSKNIDLRGKDFELLPFGSGRRGCPGMYLGLIHIRLVVAQLVHCFDWDLPNVLSVGELDMTEKFGVTLPRANHLLAVPTYRL